MIAVHVEPGERCDRAVLAALRSAGIEVTLVDDASVDAPYVVRAARAEGGKCERCWTFSRKVGKLAAHPGVCERCADVLQAR